ncbi:hypothetical protein RMSM_00203 [Rhodopirellula maiorica SM1]|uniref:Uncharacterized protein n=1 Tax=Rhodopirellula maiorica SM1 TaxID=1265738 RepID=M5RU61_9BACT|nr:hypothetical protein RMSM_00203 [Rhodopirellula maiorica SM1]
MANVEVVRLRHLVEYQGTVDGDPKLPFLNSFNTTVICNSRWRCDQRLHCNLATGVGRQVAGQLPLDCLERFAWESIG